MSASDRPAFQARLGSLLPLLPALGVMLGVLALAGWYFHLPALVQIRPNLAPMQYNTALCFVLAGLALVVAVRRGSQRAILALGGFVALCAGLTLGEYLFNASFGIDQLFFRSYIFTETSHPGRMSPVSSLCLTLTGTALVLLGLRTAPRWRPLALGALASIIISISMVALLGYILGLPGTYGWGQLTRMAMHTACGVGLLGGTLFILAWQMGCEPGERTPRWLPVTHVLAVLTASLVLYFALDSKQNQEIAQTVKAGAESAKNQITVRMESRVRSLVRMARRWEFSGAPPQAVWEADAANHVHDFPDLQALEWIDTAHTVRWVVPLEGNEAKLNRDLTQEERRKAAVELAEREHQPVITHIVPLFRGGYGFIVYVPIMVHDRFDGFIAAIFNAQACLQRYLPSTVAAGEAIQISEGGLVFYERDAAAPPARDGWLVEEKIALHGTTWDLQMWPTRALAKGLDSPLPGVVLWAGALGALLLGALCFYAQRFSRQAAATARANASLQAALAEVKTLEGLLPICACCKRVRDDTGYWNQIDTYLDRHTNASLSHGYCPECAAKAFKEFGLEVPESLQAEIKAHNYE